MPEEVPAEAKAQHIQTQSTTSRLAALIASIPAMALFHVDSLTEILFLSRILIIIRHSWIVIQVCAIAEEAEDGDITHNPASRRRIG
jgi:hypothetical protein